MHNMKMQTLFCVMDWIFHRSWLSDFKVMCFAKFQNFRKTWICADKSKPICEIRLVLDTYNLCRMPFYWLKHWIFKAQHTSLVLEVWVNNMDSLSPPNHYVKHYRSLEWECNVRLKNQKATNSRTVKLTDRLFFKKIEY